MSTLSPVSSVSVFRPTLVRATRPTAVASAAAGLLPVLQSGTIAFGAAANGAVDATARVSDANLDPSTTKLSLTLDLKANQQYSFSFYYASGGPKVSLVDAAGKKTPITMARGFSVATSGTYQLVFESAYSLKQFASLDNLSIHAKSVLPRTTGDRNLDALLMGGTNQWWRASGATAAVGTDAVSKTAKALAAGSSVTNLTYSFLTAAQAGKDPTNFQEMTTAQKDAVRRVFDYYAKLINVTFTETATSGAGDINFASDVQNASAGYANLPKTSADGKSYVYLASNATTNNDVGVQEGGYGWLTILHEVGHALGLKHPGNYNAGGGGAPGPYLSGALDNRQQSMMSYKDNDASRGMIGTSAMMLDVAALQYLYGVNKSGSTATNGTFTFNANQDYLRTLWSGTGNDTIDLSGLTHSSMVDLNGGTYSSINIKGPKTNKYYSGNNNVGIAYGSEINNVALSTASGVAETVALNKAFANNKFDTLTSFDAGADKIALKRSIFGALSGANVEFGAAATKTTSKIVVDTATGSIYYDADGSGTASSAKKIAQYSTLQGGNLSAANFLFVA